MGNRYGFVGDITKLRNAKKPVQDLEFNNLFLIFFWFIKKMKSLLRWSFKAIVMGGRNVI
jgi:hypothetical protein